MHIFAGLWAEQPAAAPPASTVQVRVGEDATLRCPLLDIPAGAVLSWYRRAAGRSLELLLSIKANGRVKHGPGVRPDKVSAATDGSLQLRASQRGDAAVYYCSASQPVV